jgi:SAM-dependent methyltransferase
LNCPVCFSAKTESHIFDFPFFRQLDFKTIRSSGVIARCCSCQLLFQIIPENDIAEIEHQFTDDAYARSKQTSQTHICDDFDEPVTRSFLQAQLLDRALKQKKISVLDIGCFDGKLLFELGRRFENVDLHGFDVFDYREYQDSESDHRFWSGDLDNIDRKFDLICFSHSLMYMKDLPCLMEHITRLREPNGILFIQTPDISSNPCYILMGDQFFYFTPQILKNILQCFGFSFSVIENKWFPREIVGIAEFRSATTDNSKEDLQIYRCVEDLKKKKNRLEEISGTDMGVLGTTSNAAFVDSILGDRVSRFFDEMPDRAGSKFRQKDVLHPELLPREGSLVIPYGESGNRIKERFSGQYPGNFIVV